MKPSIFIMSKYKLINLNEFSNNQHYLDILDKRFIDREEIKNKINKEFELHRTIFKCKAVFTEKGFNNLKKEILELIDK